MKRTKVIIEFELPEGHVIPPENRLEFLKVFMGTADLLCASMDKRQGIVLNYTVSIK